MTLFRTVGIPLLCKHEPSVLFHNASGFIISVCNLTLWFAITAFSSQYLMRLTVLANDASTSLNSMPDVSSNSRRASSSRCFDSVHAMAIEVSPHNTQGTTYRPVTESSQSQGRYQHSFKYMTHILGLQSSKYSIIV